METQLIISPIQRNSIQNYSGAFQLFAWEEMFASNFHKKILCLFLCIFGLLEFSYSQDKLYRYDGSQIDAKVLEVTQDEIKYKKFSYLEGPTIVVAKSDIVMIIYENGEKDIFAEENVEPISKEVPIENTKTEYEMYLQGKQDASSRYTSYRPFWGTFVPTVIFAPAGVVAGVIIGSTSPSPKVIAETMPDAKLIVNQDYYRGYKKKMRQKKWGRVCGGFGIGIAVNVVTYYLIWGGR